MKHVLIEKQALGYGLAAFVTLTILEMFLYFGVFQSIPQFAQRYGWWLFYSNISIAALGAAAWHLYTYKTHVPCMAGMMIGMTVGMQTGMMIGAIIGGTNGFFTGSMVAVIAGVAAGVIAGRCCGVMGIMEGMMAGLMGGTMGPMISVMMLNDHLLWFMPLFTIVNVVILIGLMHMYLKEVVAPQEVSRRSLDGFTFVSMCVIATAILVAIMLYGPKSALFGG